MSEIKHTPGPWSVSFECVDPEWAIVATRGGVVIANVNADHRQDANARLIAAAPETTDALRNLLSKYVELLNFINWAEDRPEVAAARAAIAKAEGRQP